MGRKVKVWEGFEGFIAGGVKWQACLKKATLKMHELDSKALQKAGENK